ncbi:MAG: hypothetical protein P0Y65_14590 [Candidatus Devosia phytovorans]|uniref:Uncharacterized protein n=1 Tax=Candidatus Devosia phytovorans TaxID=3121372 RepID=A0AAJ5VSN7_9HYPH|nr:hypothetical protein [Devosia sp.]WEK03415.1 MAG: hypothetical protein P0Y65_14590 [Devosia sp.]
MGVVEKPASVEIVQQNRRGPGRMASRSLGLSVGLGIVAIFIVVILVILITRSLTGLGAREDIVGFVLLPPFATVFLVVAIFELSMVLPRRLRIDASGIHVRFSPWTLRPAKHLPRRTGQQAEAWKQRQSNYATYPSGHTSHAPFVSTRFVIRYGRRLFGPVDEDQAQCLAEAINAALERTAPMD